MDRRAMLALLAGSVAAAVSACTARPTSEETGGSGPVAGPTTPPTTTGRTPGPAAPAFGGRLFGPPTGVVKVPVPKGTLSKLPGTG